MPSSIKKLSAWALPAAAAFIFLFQLGSIPLWSGDEGRFGEIAREMVELREFLIPQFFYIHFLEKPILYPLSAALSCMVWGVGSFAVRFPSAVAALCGIGMTWWFTRRFAGERAAVRSAVVLTTFLGYVLIGRFAVIDMMLTLFVSAAIFCLGTAAIEKRGNFYLAAYAFMGAAFLTKGLLGVVVPALVFGGFLVWTRNLGEILRMRLGWGILILAAMILPYGIAVSMRQPEFSYVFIMENHFLRYSSGSFGRHRPLWFFLPIYLATCLPWAFYLPAAVSEGWKSRPESKAGLYRRLHLVWIAAVLIFFSLPKSKLPYYILPTAMPTAVLIGSYFAGPLRVDSRTVKWMMIGLIGLGWPALFAAAVYINFYASDPMLKTLAPFAWPALAAVVASGAALVFFQRKNRPDGVFWTLAAAAYLFLLVTICGMKPLSPYFSTQEFARTLQDGLAPDDVVAVYASPDRFSDFPFHLKRRVMVVGSDRGTIDEESRDAEHREQVSEWFLEKAEFARLFNAADSGRRVYCLVDREHLHELEQVGMKGGSVLMEFAGRVLVSNGKTEPALAVKS